MMTGLTETYLIARSNLNPKAFEGEKLKKCIFLVRLSVAFISRALRSFSDFGQRSLERNVLLSRRNY